MGQLFMYDAYQSHFNETEFDLFDLDDVDLAFERMVQLKFQQTMQLPSRGNGLSITPLPAGHMLGSTLWKIVKDNEETIVYAVDFNHKKERHLNGASFELALRPSLLILDCYNCQYQQKRRHNRDKQLVEQILRTVRDGGNVLIATDTAGRCLELAHLLEQIWQNQESGLMAYSLALLNNVSENVVDFAKSLVEWMSDKVARHFEYSRDNPFAFRHLHLCNDMAMLDKVREPKVVLASHAELQSGFARQLFTKWCQNPKNSVILTQRASVGTLARTLLDHPEQRTVQLDLRQRVPLEPHELEALAKKQQEDAAAAAAASAASAKAGAAASAENGVDGGAAASAAGALPMDGVEDDLDDDVHVTGVVPAGSSATAAPGGHRAVVGQHATATEATGGARHGYDLLPVVSASGGQFFRAVKKTQLLFPFHEPRVTFDDYGETIDPQEYASFPELMVTQAAAAEAREGADNAAAGLSGTGNDDEEPALDRLEAAAGDTVAAAEPCTAAVGPPTKCVVEPVMLDINANVRFIDFEGRSDGEAIKKIISTIRAREVILVRGSAAASNHLAEYCRTSMSMPPDAIHTPAQGDTVDVTKEGHIYQARIKDSLVSSLNFFKVRDSELAWIEADVRVEEAEAAQAAQRAVRGDLVPTLDVPRGAPELLEHDTVFVGEPKLSDLKLVLQQRGMTAEFSGGILIVNGQVALVKTEGGKLLLEGCMCEDYYKVRELLYGQYAIL